MSVAERLHNVAAHNFSTNYTEAHLFLLGRTSLQIVCDAARAPIRRIPTSAAWTALAELRTPSEISWLTIPIEAHLFSDLGKLSGSFWLWCIKQQQMNSA
jgi:hypothetical protein